MNTPRFVKDKWSYISVVAIILLIIIAVEVTFSRLDKFTRHGEELIVPDLVGMNYEEAQEKYKDIFHFQLVDSVYVRNFPEGAVYQQNPKKGQTMKKGRNMYIVRTSIAPEVVKMPNLKNLSLRQAMVRLNSVGLKVKKLVYVDYFARNAIVNQLVDGEVIMPYDDIVKGTAVTLEVGLGNGDKTTHLPELVGVPFKKTKDFINGASLNLGSEIFIDSDEEENLYVCRMEPAYNQSETVPLGSDVNVWYKSIKTFDFNWYVREKHRRDSIVGRLRIKKADEDKINYVIDSFNYILSHRSFSYDPKRRDEDMNMKYIRPDEIEYIEGEDIYFNDTEVDKNYFYDE